MLVQNLKVQLIGPPVPVGRASADRLLICSACYGAFAFVSHKIASFISERIFEYEMNYMLRCPSILENKSMTPS
jgi:hypothetical protein